MLLIIYWLLAIIECNTWSITKKHLKHIRAKFSLQFHLANTFDIWGKNECFLYYITNRFLLLIFKVTLRWLRRCHKYSFCYLIANCAHCAFECWDVMLFTGHLSYIWLLAWRFSYRAIKFGNKRGRCHHDRFDIRMDFSKDMDLMFKKWTNSPWALI